jgi:hypothetical protein
VTQKVSFILQESDENFYYQSCQQIDYFFEELVKIIVKKLTRSNSTRDCKWFKISNMLSVIITGNQWWIFRGDGGTHRIFLINKPPPKVKLDPCPMPKKK